MNIEKHIRPIEQVNSPIVLGPTLPNEILVTAISPHICQSSQLPVTRWNFYLSSIILYITLQSDYKIRTREHGSTLQIQEIERKSREKVLHLAEHQLLLPEKNKQSVN
jgi:hypothetical protein